MKKKLKIFICPLDWGIGHATRCVPVIHELLGLGHEVVIGADGRSKSFLESTFPGLTSLHFPGFRINYPANGKMARKMLFLAPQILMGIRREHKLVKKLVRQHAFDLVISDNRFGLYHCGVPSYYITHQLMIKTPANYRWMEPILQRYHHSIIRKFDRCWIPDLPGEINLSGDLSHKYPLPSNASFIGPLSRFTTRANSPGKQPEYKIALLISGPEPQRTIFEQMWVDTLEKAPFRSIMFRGLPEEEKQARHTGNIKVYNHADDEVISRTLLNSEIVVARSGYSSVMDLCALGKNALLVPTPGQTEQEYLADYLAGLGYFAAMPQQPPDLKAVLAKTSQLKPLPDLFTLHLLRDQLKALKLYD